MKIIEQYSTIHLQIYLNTCFIWTIDHNHQANLFQNKNYFQERPEGTSWTPLDKIMQNVSIPDEIKQSLYKSMTVCFHPILNDKNVLALMFLLLTFAQDESENDSEVVRMVSQY